MMSPEAHKDRVWTAFIAITIGVCMLSLGIGGMLGARLSARAIYQQAVDNGAMYYDPLTGQPVWVKRPKVEIRERKE